MNKLAALSLLTVGALTFAPKSALAGHGRGGDEALAAIGGFLGGLIVGTAINDRPAYSHYDRTVLVSSRYDRYDRRDDCRDDRGYWKHVTVKTWVPGYWTTSYRHGRCVRYHVNGHWSYRTKRVWVSYDRHDRHDRYGYGYGR